MEKWYLPLGIDFNTQLLNFNSDGVEYLYYIYGNFVDVWLGPSPLRNENECPSRDDKLVQSLEGRPIYFFL